MNQKRTGVSPHNFHLGPHIMGVLNVTPDSFSDGGCFFNHDSAIERGVQLIDEGAHIIDVGGESTRPGAEPVDVDQEIERVIPVIQALSKLDCLISIDTRNARTMREAVRAGAHIINDVSALTHDPESMEVAAQSRLPVILMHMQGTPETMQSNPRYNNVIDDIFEFLSRRISTCETHGIDADLLIVDPGIGFGKTVEDNLLVLRNIRKFHDLKAPILLGVSRKSFIAKISDNEPPDERIAGSLSAALWGLSQGVQIFRVHDVKETRRAFSTFQAISEAGS